MYRCIQSETLWYNSLTKILQEEGWEESQVDAYMMLKLVQDKMCIIMMYVDDLLRVETKEEMEI